MTSISSLTQVSVSLTTSFFNTLHSLLKSTGVVSSLPISNLSISDFKLAKSNFFAKFHVSTPIALFECCIIKKNLIKLLICFYHEYMVHEINSFYIIIIYFLSIQLLKELS